MLSWAYDYWYPKPNIEDSQELKNVVRTPSHGSGKGGKGGGVITHGKRNPPRKPKRKVSCHACSDRIPHKQQQTCGTCGVVYCDKEVCIQRFFQCELCKKDACLECTEPIRVWILHNHTEIDVLLCSLGCVSAAQRRACLVRLGHDTFS